MAELGARLSRDLSFKHRFRLNFGFDEEFYGQCLAYKDDWQDKLFYVDEDIVLKEQEWIVRQLGDSAQLDIPDASLQPLSRKQVEQHVGVADLEIELWRNGNASTLRIPVGEGVSLQPADRRGFILNTGGQITSMKWLPQPHKHTETLYLAVSVFWSPKGVDFLVNNPELSIFNTAVSPNNDMMSTIQIWKDDPTGVKLDKVYVTTRFGAVSQLSFLPARFEGSVLGVVGALCSDGRLRFLKIHGTDTFSMVTSPSLSYELADYRSSSLSAVVSFTSYDYLGCGRILGGFSDGSLAEFIIPTTSDMLYSMPSFVQAVSDTAITSVSVAEPAPSSYFVSVNTSGSLSFVFEYGNFVQGRVEASSTNSLLKPVAHPFLKVFVGSDSADSIGYSFVRHPHDKPGSLVKTEGVVTAVHLSEYVGHPLALCGNSFGEIHVINICRKLLNGTKSTNKTLVPMRLWKMWQRNSKIELYGDFEVVPTDKPTRIAATPVEIVFSAVAWNETVVGSSSYAAGTLLGLLLVEKLLVA